MQPCTAPSFQFHNSFCSVLCSSLMHLVLAVKCGLFSMFSIKSCIWKWFIKITDRRPVEIGLQGPIILWKMSARVGFASQRLSIIDSLIQILCSDCKQWPMSRFYTVAANSSLGHRAHLCSFTPASSSFALTVFVSFVSWRKVTSLTNNVFYVKYYYRNSSSLRDSPGNMERSTFRTFWRTGEVGTWDSCTFLLNLHVIYSLCCCSMAERKRWCSSPFNCWIYGKGKE